MYRCDACEHEFAEEEALSREEFVGECWGRPAYESFTVCPRCCSSELTELETCKGCGKGFDPDELKRGYCAECRQTIYDSLTAYIKRTYTADEIDVIIYGIENS